MFLTTLAGANLKVRLLAVDIPEVGDNLECLGPEATDYLRGLLPEGSTVYTQADVEPLDQYGRSLLFVWTSSGQLVNLSLVADGYAEAVFIGDNWMLEAEVEAAEDAAQAAAAAQHLRQPVVQRMVVMEVHGNPLCVAAISRS